jgi:hypothetical protein
MAWRTKSLLGALIATVVIFVAAAPVSASCAAPLSLDEALASADLVVVGTVVAARSNDRIATVAIEDIWKGDAEASIGVAGGPDSLNGATSVDRTYQVGTRYLFFIFEPAVHNSPGTFGARYEDNGCTDTRPYTAALDSLRPASAHRLVSAPSTTPTTSTGSATASNGTNASENRSSIFVIAAAVLLVGGLLAATVIVRHRRGLLAGA